MRKFWPRSRFGRIAELAQPAQARLRGQRSLPRRPPRSPAEQLRGVALDERLELLVGDAARARRRSARCASTNAGWLRSLRTAAALRYGASVSTSRRSSGTRSAASREVAGARVGDVAGERDPHSGCSRHSSRRSGIEKQCRITRTPSARSRSVAIVSSSAARVWITSGLPVVARELDLGVRTRAAGRRAARGRGSSRGRSRRSPRSAGARRAPQLGEVGVVEAASRVGVAADRGADLREALGGGERAAAALARPCRRSGSAARRPARAAATSSVVGGSQESGACGCRSRARGARRLLREQRLERADPGRPARRRARRQRRSRSPAARARASSFVGASPAGTGAAARSARAGPRRATRSTASSSPARASSLASCHGACSST